MEIKSIDIKILWAGGLKGNAENVTHSKSLPYLSIVQSIHCCYEIGLDGATPLYTEEGGAFVTPSGAMQSITHHNGSNGYIEAHWVFMQIIINEFFELEDLFQLPLLLSSAYRNKLFSLIDTIKSDPHLCRKYAAAYQLTDILIANSVPKNSNRRDSVILLKRYINEHYNEVITNDDLARVAFCSTPNLYRIFQKSFSLSPHNYINKVRLEKALFLLESSDYSVSEIAAEVGFDDPIYYSKLFKKSYHLSPKNYRENSTSRKQGKR